MKSILLLILAIAAESCFAQRMVISGDVKDVNTGKPLAYATIGVSNHIEQTVTDSDGKFELTVTSAKNDTLIVTYIGYSKFTKIVNQLEAFEHIVLSEFATVLEQVTIMRYQLDLRDVDRDSRVIRDNLYAMSGEVTNIDYNTFLSWLEDAGKADLKKKCDFQLNAYPKSVREYYQRYHQPGHPKKDIKRNRRDSVESFNSYPVVNITYESAVEYCKWLTDRYNENTKRKKFKRFRFDCQR
ncbi:MAG: carboxypeptidase-like regulatory domain-containing protein [Bacteroidota bacterium]